MGLIQSTTGSKHQDWAAGGATATRRPGSAPGGVSVSHLHVGWAMALLCLGLALPRWLVRAFALETCLIESVISNFQVADPRRRVVL